MRFHPYTRRSLLRRSPTAAALSTGAGEQPKALVLHPSPFSGPRERRELHPWLLSEAVGLAKTLGYDVVYEELVRQRAVVPRTFLGKGKVEDLRGIAAHTGASLAFINTPMLTALQQSELSERLGVPVVRDRMGVILDIFASRARTNEAKRQVELARLKYDLSHVVKSGTHYDQQAGGFGFMAGGGERATEVQRRVIREKIRVVEKKLEVVRKRRRLQREDRHQPVVSLIGYTNAGKSSLLNRLTRTESVAARDRPFETLDTTVRSLYLPPLDASCLLTDTVGFITDLPHDLVAAFRATLEEIASADVLLHVRDVSTVGSPIFEAQKRSVLKVLDEMRCPQALLSGMVEVWNKADLVEGRSQDDADTMHRLDLVLQKADRAGQKVVLTSTKTGRGMDELLATVSDGILSTGRARFFPADKDEEEEQEEAAEHVVGGTEEAERY